jgi:hypothetical protein
MLAIADPHDNTHYLKQIPDFGDRWLRIGEIQVLPLTKGELEGVGQDLKL